MDAHNDIDVAGIEKIISHYEYGQFNILGKPLDITYDLDAREIKLNPFYNKDYLNNKDTCLGLAQKGYFDIRLGYPELFVARVVGNDNEFFSIPGQSQHCFLLASKNDMMDYRSMISNPWDIDYVFAANPMLIDPSFKKVIPLRKSGYKINAMFNHDYQLPKNNSRKLMHNNQEKTIIPLVFTQKGMLMNIKPDFHSKHYLGIVLQDKYIPGNMGLQAQEYPLESEKLDEILFDDHRAYQFIELLRNCEKKPAEKKIRRAMCA